MIGMGLMLIVIVKEKKDEYKRKRQFLERGKKTNYESISFHKTKDWQEVRGKHNLFFKSVRFQKKGKQVFFPGALYQCGFN